MSNKEKDNDFNQISNLINAFDAVSKTASPQIIQSFVDSLHWGVAENINIYSPLIKNDHLRYHSTDLKIFPLSIFIIFNKTKQLTPYLTTNIFKKIKEQSHSDNINQSFQYCIIHNNPNFLKTLLDSNLVDKNDFLLKNLYSWVSKKNIDPKPFFELIEQFSWNLGHVFEDRDQSAKNSTTTYSIAKKFFNGIREFYTKGIIDEAMVSENFKFLDYLMQEKIYNFKIENFINLPLKFSNVDYIYQKSKQLKFKLFSDDFSLFFYASTVFNILPKSNKLTKEGFEYIEYFKKIIVESQYIIKEKPLDLNSALTWALENQNDDLLTFLTTQTAKNLVWQDQGITALIKQDITLSIFSEKVLQKISNLKFSSKEALNICLALKSKNENIFSEKNKPFTLNILNTFIPLLNDKELAHFTEEIKNNKKISDWESAILNAKTIKLPNTKKIKL